MLLYFFFFNDTATTEIYTLSLHDALPICLLLDVFDCGDGFLEKDLPHVFERFYRSDTSRTRSGDPAISNGTGLGLSIVQKIVESHQGKVQAKNHPDTGGAWLQVWLPTSLVGAEPNYSSPR